MSTEAPNVMDITTRLAYLSRKKQDEFWMKVNEAEREAKSAGRFFGEYDFLKILAEVEDGIALCVELSR